MSDEFETDFEEATPQPSHRPEDMTIQELRRLATSFGIKAQRDWVREDFIMAINNRRNKNESLVTLVTPDSGNTPPPGHARISLHSTQTGSNHPIPVAVNNYVCRIPRDVVVDVPIPVMEALNNSKTPIRVRDPKGGVDQEGKPKLVWKEVPSYPFQVIAVTPGEARYSNGTLKVRPSTGASKQGLREKYREIYGRWPDREQYKKFHALHMERKAEQHFSKEDIELAKESK